MLDARVQARVQSHRQAVTRRVNRVDHFVEVVLGVADHMQYRTEVFAFEIADRVDLVGDRRKIVTAHLLTKTARQLAFINAPAVRA